MKMILIETILNFSYFGVFLLICLENLFPPIPSEIILTFAGYLTIQYDSNIFLMIFSSTFGSWIGAEILYYLGHTLQPLKFEKFLNKMRFELKYIDKTNEWFHTYGSFTVFICRFIPIIRSLISIPAGMTKMKHLSFTLYTILGSLIWTSILIYIGRTLGKNYELIANMMDQYSIFLILIIIVLLIIYILKKRKRY